MALGYGAEADVSNVSGKEKNPDKESQSIAIGYMATAKQNNIALGAGSIATEKASTTAALYTNQKAPASYVSVGSTVIENGKTTSTLRRITNVADGAADTDVATIAQLNKVAAEKGTWKLTAGGTNSTTVNATNNTVDFSAAKDSKNGSKDYSNLTVSKGEEDNNVTIGLKKDVILGQAVSGEGGSLSVYQDPGSVKTTDKENGYDQLGSHTKLDGSTISIRYNNGTSDSDARGVVLGIANDSYADPNDSKKTVNSPLGYLYLQDGKNYYYIHGAMHGDTNYQGRLAYDTESSSNYIANLDDGLKFTGDTKNITVETKLDPNVAKNTLSIKGGVTDSGKLTSGNIGVVATANTTDEKGNVASAGGLSIQLAKNLTGITSISNQPTSATTTTGAKIELGTNGTTISGGDVNVSSNKITNLKNGEADTDAATVGQMNTAIGNAKTKYYSVNDKNSITQNTLPTVTGLLATNSDNLGAKGMGSLASGFSTEADGTLSTVGGSYSGVINEGSVPYLLGVDIRGTAAVSYGTGNMNKSTAKSGTTSGVANSLIGQVNDVTDSNAAIAIGAGNTISNSYRDVTIDPIKVWMNRHNPEALRKLMKDAVKESGGQVMVMGGGNNVESAYMSQVVGVGNTVKGNQVKNDKGEWVTDTSTDTSNTAIQDYDPEKSSQYNYVDGFNNEVINGKHDYIIGANNKLSGDSYDDKDAKKYSNESNIVFGDNHTLTNTKNAVIIGSSDTQMILDKGDNATAIGHNASAQRDALAVGVNTEARGNAVALGTSTIAHNNSIAIGTKATAVSSQNLAIGWEAHIGNIKTDDEKIKNAVALGSDSQVRVNDLLESDNNRGVLSIGDKDKERRIIHVRAGVNDTDAVNVSQLKSVQSDLTGKGLKFAANSGDEYTAKLGSKVTIQGTAKKEGHEYTADNLTTTIDEKGNITILMDKNVSAEKIAVNGKDGKNGKPGTAGSIGINGQDGKSGIGIDGKDGISIKGRDGKDGVTMKAVDGENGTEGHIGLTGPAGTNGKDGTNAIDITVKNGYDKAGQDGKDGINGKNGVDGTSLTRIVYKDGAGEHQVATMEDGLKFKGDDSTVIAKKLNNTLDVIGGAKGDLTEGNIGVNSTKDGKLKVQLAKDLTGITSISNQTTTKVGDEDVTTGAKITLGTDGTTTISGGDVNVSGNKITHVGSGIETDANGKYTVTDQNKGNAANIGDVQNMVNEAVNSAADTTNKALAGKANIDASNIGANLKNADGSVASAEDQKANAEKWGSAIGTGKIEKDNGQLVTGKTVYDEVRPKVDGSYVKKDKTTGENLSALDSKVGSMDKDGIYIKKDASVSSNLNTLDTQVKANADAISKEKQDREAAITNITNNIGNLSDSAVKYDANTNKTKSTLAGKNGTTITHVKDGALSDSSSDAVNGKQLYNEQKAREAADNAITEKVTNNTNEITKIKNGEGFTDTGKTIIKNLSKDAVQVKAGDRIKVDEATDETTGNKTYKISANNNGTVREGDGNLISGDTLYNEVHVTTDGSYIKGSQTVGQNLSALDSGLKTTSDLIHTNTKGDTIQIGGNSTATKVDISGKDGKGRVITGVVSDANDPNSAANVGYVNGLTAANTQQIYRDMNNAYSRLDTNINRAAAGSNALAALHPLDFDPADKASFAVGYGHYRNANAAAVGAFYQPNANTMVNMGISLGNGDPGFNAGVSFKIGKGSAYNGVSKAEMAQTIHDQATEISAIKADDAAKDKRIDALEKENQEMKKQIQEILARLNG